MPRRGPAAKLMAQADSENRHAAQEVANGVDGVIDRLGIAGADGEKDAVGLEGEDILGVVSAGTTVTRQPSRVSILRMFSLIPKS